MKDSMYHDTKSTLKSRCCFLYENAKILPYIRDIIVGVIT